MYSNHKNFPLISVIMPVYNREVFLGEAVESILHQSYTNFEVILADDGSTDGSADLIREYARRDRRIHPLFLSHRGIPKTFNRAVSMARGSLIARMDSDDIALPQRFAVQIEWMRQRDVDLCGSHVELFGSHTDTLCEKDSVRWAPESHEAVIREMLFCVSVWGGAMLMRAEVCRENPFNEAIDFTDCEWPQQMALKYTMGNVPQVLLKVRRHGENITKEKHVNFVRCLSKTRFQYFYSLFPNTPLADYLAFARIADGTPMTSLWELQRAGQWLLDFAGYPDKELRRRMAKRWEETCDRSSGLGAACDKIYLRYRQQMSADSWSRSDLSEKRINK